MKCGICQKKRTPKRIHPRAETVPSAADHPISGGKAPAIAPISVLQRLERFAGVYQPGEKAMAQRGERGLAGGERGAKPPPPPEKNSTAPAIKRTPRGRNPAPPALPPPGW